MISLLLLIVLRGWLAGVLPLTDTTEARYAEMARKMVETGDWLMPQHAYGVPYLGKPPFAFWQSALGIDLLGANELAARLPILLWSIAFGGIFFMWLESLFGRRRAFVGLLVLASTLLFYVSMAAVMTDMLLTICVATALMAFWSRHHGGSGLIEAAMYIALGIGLLTKGPLAAVLVLLPIGVWAITTRQLGRVWRRFAWIRGGILTAAIALPWYAAAEWRHPGFLSYFILGEHFGRFLIPGWSGDLYGFAHELPRGTIWVLYLLALMPWPILLAPFAFTDRDRIPAVWASCRSLILFASLWAAAPLVLFTFSANVIWPYVLPALPATVVLLIAFSTSSERGIRRMARLGWVAAAFTALGAVAITKDVELIGAHTKKQAIAQINDRHPQDGFPIYYWGRQYFSAEFYSHGRATRLQSLDALDDFLNLGRDFSLIVRRDGLASLPASVRARLETVEESNDMILLEPRRGSVDATDRVRALSAASQRHLP